MHTLEACKLLCVDMMVVLQPVASMLQVCGPGRPTLLCTQVRYKYEVDWY